MKFFFCVFSICLLLVNVAVAQSRYEIQPPELRKAIEQWQANCQNDTSNSLIYNKMQFQFELPSDASVYDSIGQRFINYYRTNDLMVVETAYQRSRNAQGLVCEQVITQQSKGLNSEALYNLSTQFQPFIFSEPLLEIGKSSYVNPISKEGLGYYQFFLKSKRIDSLGDTIACYGFTNEKDAGNRALEGIVDVNLQTSVLQCVVLQNDIDADSLHFELQLSFAKIDEQTIRPDVMQCSLKMPNRITKFDFPIVGQGKSQVSGIEGDVVLSSTEGADSLQVVNDQKHQDEEQLTKMQKQLLDGYLPGGVIRVDYRKLIDYTNYEGWKLGVGLWTGDSISQRISAGGFFVHSFKRVDNNIGAGIKAKLSKSGNSLVSFHWSDAFGATGVVSFLNGYKPLSAEAFGRFLTSTMDRVVDYQLAGETNLALRLKGKVNLRYADVSPQMHYRYVIQDDVVEQPFRQNEIMTQFCWRPQVFDNQNVTTAFFLNFSYGTTNLNEVEPYRRTEVQMQLSNRFYSRGTTFLRITAGQINGKIPTTLYYSSFGTMADWGIDIPYMFNTMKMNEFAADRLLLLNLRHEHQLSIGERFKPCLAFTQNLGYGDVDASGLATFNRGFFESGLAFNNLLHLGIFQYGCSFHYRYGAYRLPDFGQNFVFKFNIGIDAF